MTHVATGGLSPFSAGLLWLIPIENTPPILRLITCARGLPTWQRAGCHELFICQIPSSTQRLVELKNDQAAVDLRLRQRKLCWIESLQGIQKFDVAGKPFHVTHPGQTDCFLVPLHSPDLSGQCERVGKLRMDHDLTQKENVHVTRSQDSCIPLWQQCTPYSTNERRSSGRNRFGDNRSPKAWYSSVPDICDKAENRPQQPV